MSAMYPNEFGNSPFYLTPAQKQKLVEYKRAKEAENVNYLTEIPKQLLGGFIQGFTTLNPIDEPMDIMGGLARSIGSLMGFIGYVPGPGLAGKLGLSKLLKATGVSKAFGWERRFGPSLLEGRAFIPVPSIPMQVADKVTNLGERFFASNKAAEAAIKMLSAEPMVADVLRGGIHLGIASAVGSAQPWEVHAKERMEGFVSGFSLGAFNKVLGNVIQPKGIIDFSQMFKGADTMQKLGPETTNALARMVAGGLYMGLPSTLAGQPLPIQLYEYVLGGYFGFKEMDINHREAKTYIQRHSAFPAILMGRGDMESYRNLRPEVQKLVDIDADLIVGKMINSPIGEVSESAGIIGKAGMEAVEKLWEKAETPEQKRVVEAQKTMMDMITQVENEEITKLNKATRSALLSKIKAYKKAGKTDEEAMDLAQKDTGAELVEMFRATSQYMSPETMLGKRKAVTGKDYMAMSQQYGRSIREYLEDYEVPTQMEVPMQRVRDKLRQIPELTAKWQETEDELGELMRKHTILFKGKMWDESNQADQFMVEFKEKFLDGKVNEKGKPVTLNEEESRLITRLWKDVSQRMPKNDLVVNTGEGFLDNEDRPVQGDLKEPVFSPNKIGGDGLYAIPGGASTFFEDTVSDYHATKGGVPTQGVDVTIRVTQKNQNVMEWLSQDGPEMFRKRISKLFYDLASRMYIPLGGVKTKGVIKATAPVLDEFGEKNYYDRLVNWMQKEDQQGFEQFEKDRQDFIKDNSEIEPGKADMIWKRIHANKARILEILNGNFNHGLTFEEIMNEPGFIQGADKLNKYWQVLDDPSYSMNWRVFSSIKDAVAIPGLMPDGSTDTIVDFRLKYLTLKAQNTVHIDYLVKEGIIPKEFGDVLRDGGVLVRSDVMKAIKKENGIHPKSGSIKGVIFDNENPFLGAMFGKQAFHDVSPRLNQWMWENGIHYLQFDTTAKQLGKRQVYEAVWDGTKAPGEEFTFYMGEKEGEIPVTPTPDLLPSKALKINIGASEHFENAFEDTTVKTAFYKHLKRPENMKWLWDNLYGKPYIENTEWSDYLKRFPTTKEKYDQKFSPNKLSDQQLIDAVEGTKPVPEAFLRRLVWDVMYNDKDPAIFQEREANEENFSFMDDQKYKVAARRLLDEADKITPGLLHQNGVWRYFEGAFKNYLRRRDYYPIAEESFTVTLTPIEHGLEPLVKEGWFWLGKDAQDKPMMNPVTGKEDTLGGIFRMWQKTKSGVLLKKLRPVIERVPTDSLSGMRVLKLAGFVDRPGMGIYLHPKDMKYLGGADTDGDKGYVYWGMPDSITSEIAADRNKYSIGTGKDEVFQVAEDEDARRFKPDPVTGAMPDEYVKHNKKVHMLNMYEGMKSALWGYEGQQNTGSQINIHERFSMLKSLFPDGMWRDLSSRDNWLYDDYSRQMDNGNVTTYVDNRLRQMGVRGIEEGDKLFQRWVFKDHDTVENSNRNILNSTIDAAKGEAVWDRKTLLEIVQKRLAPDVEHYILRKGQSTPERVDPAITMALEVNYKGKYTVLNRMLSKMSTIKNASFRGQAYKGKPGAKTLQKISLLESQRFTNTAMQGLPGELIRDIEKFPNLSMRIANARRGMDFTKLRTNFTTVNKAREKIVREAFSERFNLLGKGYGEEMRREKIIPEGQVTKNTLHSLEADLMWQAMANVKYAPDKTVKLLLKKRIISPDMAVEMYRQLQGQDYSDMASYFMLRDAVMPLSYKLWDQFKELNPDADQWSIFHQIKNATKRIRQLAEADRRLLAVKSMDPSEIKLRDISEDFLTAAGKLDYEVVQQRIQKHQKGILEVYGEEGKRWYDASLVSSLNGQYSTEVTPGGNEKLLRITPLLRPIEKPMESLGAEVRQLIGDRNLTITPIPSEDFKYEIGGELGILQRTYGGRVRIDFEHEWRPDYEMLPKVGETPDQSAARRKAFIEKSNDVIRKAREKEEAFHVKEAERDKVKKQFFDSNFVQATVIQPLVSDAVIRSYQHYYGELTDIVSNEGIDAIRSMARLMGMNTKFSVVVKKSVPAAIDGTKDYVDNMHQVRTVNDRASDIVSYVVTKEDGDIGFKIMTTAVKDLYKLSKAGLEMNKENQELIHELREIFQKRPYMLSRLDQYVEGMSGVEYGENIRTISKQGLRHFINEIKLMEHERFPLEKADYFRFHTRIGEEHKIAGDQIGAIIKRHPVWNKGTLEDKEVIQFFSTMELEERSAIEIGRLVDEADNNIRQRYAELLKNIPLPTRGTEQLGTMDMNHPALEGDGLKMYQILVDIGRKDLSAYVDSETGKLIRPDPADDSLLKQGEAAEKEYVTHFQNGEKTYRIPIAGIEKIIKASELRKGIEALRAIEERMLNYMHSGNVKDHNAFIVNLQDSGFVNGDASAKKILYHLLNNNTLPEFDVNTVAKIAHAQTIDKYYVHEQTDDGFESTGQRIGELPEPARVHYLNELLGSPKTAKWATWVDRPKFPKGYFPTDNFLERDIKKVQTREYERQLGLAKPVDMKDASEIEVSKKEIAAQELLPDKGIPAEIFRNQLMAEKDPDEVTTDLLSQSPVRRLEFDGSRLQYPGGDRTPEAFLRRMQDVNKIRGNLLVAVIHHQLREQFLKNERFGKDTEAWGFFLQNYTHQVLGFPSYYSREFYDNLELQLKHNPAWLFTDQNAANIAQKLGMTQFHGQPLFEAENLDKVMVGAMTPEGIQQRLASGTIRKKAVIDDRIRQFTNLMMKTSAMSLLFHTRGFVNNVFGGAFMNYVSVGSEPLVRSRSLKYLSQHLKVMNPVTKQIMPIRNWHDVREIVAAYGGIESFINEEALAKSGLGSVQIKAFLNDVHGAVKNDPHLKNWDAIKEIAKKHRVSDAVLNLAMLPMRSSERFNRETAWLAHFLNAKNIMELHTPAGQEYEVMHPWLVQMANRGVRATQFLYNNAARPQFAATNLGRMYSQFQLWGWNSVRFNARILREAQATGYRPGSVEYESFRRLATANALVLGLGVLFPSSLFEAALPAPWNWFKDLSQWIFGDETDKENAFYGAMPYPLNILQMVTPPVGRYAVDAFNVLVGGGEALDKFLSYKIWTWFPFGRAMRDTTSLLENPVMVVEKTTGFPLHQLQKDVQKGKLNPLTTSGSVMGFFNQPDWVEQELEEEEKL